MELDISSKRRETEMAYRFLEGLTVADIAFEATGKTLEELLQSAGDALLATEVRDPKTVHRKLDKRISIESRNEEWLLHDFLQELIFYKDAELLLFSGYDLRADRTLGGYLLEGTLRGEQLNAKKHELLSDVKAVSWHKFKVEKTKEGWRAVVILDV